MLKQKGFAPIFILIVIFIFIVIGGVVFKKSFFRENPGKFTDNTSFYEIEEEPGRSRMKIRKNNAITVPKFEQKIAFVRDQNIWIAENGKAYPVTGDATDKISDLVDKSLWYEHPIWSPDKKFLVFTQNINYSDETNLFFTDGNYISPSQGETSYRHMPYWYGNNKYLTINFFDYESKYVGSAYDYAIDEDFFVTSNLEEKISFHDLDSGADGCGGGGRPMWMNRLSQNEGSSMDPYRSTLFYISDKKKLFYSIGCQNELVKSSVLESKSSELFNPFNNVEEPKPGYFTQGTNSLLLSPDNQFIVGVNDHNIFTFDTDGKVIKQLSTSSSSYGPVISPDNLTIYYAYNLNNNPVLMKSDLSGNQFQLFESERLGAISNIHVSNNGQTILFTLITQIGDAQDWENGSLTQDLYTINSDGSNLQLFLKDASQGTW